MDTVILESPFAGQVERNIQYAKLCALDSLKRGESPMVSHLLYTQFLDDDIPAEREMGIEAGLAWRHVAEKSVVYTDHGITEGMKHGIEAAEKSGLDVEYRNILGVHQGSTGIPVDRNRKNKNMVKFENLISGVIYQVKHVGGLHTVEKFSHLTMDKIHFVSSGSVDKYKIANIDPFVREVKK